ncbi:MAG: hypothetical protein E6J90_23360 [Deltaproteobacteria bacterium]|nr:MAG: hypothetical protein E6J91_51390 [Deltaproteobacteria bacterium]TMQ16674.1 MAG: hypothetical protein E6J90_23360 [Deltaproteobacteria bacterium]
MAEGALSIKLRCASWQQLATIYKRDLSHGTMFLRAATPPAVGTAVHIDLTLPSATVIALEGVVASQVQDPQRGSGVELTLSPMPASSVWLIETALASENRRLATPYRGVAIAPVGPHQITGIIPTIHENAEVTAAEQDLIKALVSEAESLKKLNPFLVLGLGYEAGDADVRAAFGELTKRYHPDRFARYESPELRQVAAEIFILIRDAYRRLGDAAARAQVLASLGKAAPAPRAVPGPPRPPGSVPPPRLTQRVPVVPPVPPAAVATVPVATATVPMPTAAVRPPAVATPSAGVPVAPAVPALPPVPRSPDARRAPRRRPASEPSPSPSSPPPSTAHTPVVPAAPVPASGSMPAATADRRHASSQPQASTVDPAELAALEDLVDQARLDEALAGYRLLGKRHATDRNVRAGVELCEGLLALAARDRLEAAQRFESALEIDPSNERAARELAEMRRQATNERKGLLSRLMGKKEP